MTIQNPLVSIVIPCYNQGEYIEDTLISVSKSTCTDYQILIVDDGSTDLETLRVLDDLRSRGYEVITQVNKGLPAARNTGIRVARGAYILALDSDDLIGSTYLEKACLILQTRPDIAVVCPWTRTFGLNSLDWKPPTASRASLAEGNVVINAAVFRRTLWVDVGGFDESLTSGYEDYDFWLSAAERGWKFYSVPEVLFYYRVKPTSMFTDSYFKDHEIMSRLKEKHPVTLGLPTLSARGLRSVLRGFLRDNALGRMLFKIFRRDIGVLDESGFISWIKWRLFPLARSLPPVLALYRGARRKLSPPMEPARIEPTPLKIAVRAASGKVVVLYMLPWLELGGADKVNLELVRGLDGRLFQSVLATTLRSDHPWHGFFAQYTDEIFHLANLVDDDAGRLMVLDHIVASRGVTILHVSNSLEGYRLLPQLRARYGLPVVSTVHMYDPKDSWDYVREAAQCDTSIDLHVSVSHRVAAQLVTLGVDATKIRTIVNGVDLKRSLPGRGLNDRPYIVFIGRLTEQKQPEAFVRAVEELVWRGDYTRFQFIMVGSGPLEEHLRDQIRNKGLFGKISLPGPMDEDGIVNLLAHAAVLIAPSRVEGLPIVGLEAMAAGVPIIATKVSGWTELILHGLNGFLVSPAAPQKEIADLVEQLLRSPELWASVSSNARRLAAEKFDVSKMIEAYQNIYWELIQVDTRNT
ncbi:MAG: glycosyltransferase [Acidobacteriaceae bacterium]